MLKARPTPFRHTSVDHRHMANNLSLPFDLHASTLAGPDCYSIAGQSHGVTNELLCLLGRV